VSKKQPKTELEYTDELISNIKEVISQIEKELNQCDAEDPRFDYLTSDLEGTNKQLAFMEGQRKNIVSSGIIKYQYAFGSVEDIRQDFENTKFTDHYPPERLFTFKAKWILEKADTTPSKKIKMLNNLVQVYEKYKD